MTMPSDHSGIITPEVGNNLCSKSPLAVVRPETASDGGLAVPGGNMTSAFGGTGRPSTDESQRRRIEFVRLVAQGAPLDEAAAAAKINLKRALKILSEPEMRQVVASAAA